jgi:pectate lyase
VAFAGAALACGLLAAPVSGQGFGADTPGGTGKPVVTVTSLADAGPGTLREALAGGGDRSIVFAVGGVIRTAMELYVTGGFVTIDGTTAPAPGITLDGHGLVIRGNRGAHDVIVRGLRIRNAKNDGIQVTNAAHNVLIEHVSIHAAADGNLDITQGARDVTVRWSILARPRSGEKNMLISYGPARISLHHNLFVGARQRNPLVKMTTGVATDTTVDMRHNVVWGWRSGVATDIRDGVWVNVVGNYYGGTSDMKDAIVVSWDPADTPPRAYVADNVRADGRPFHPRARGNATAPLPAPAIPGTRPCEEALAVVRKAGARPLDGVDEMFVGMVKVAACEPSPAPEDAPKDVKDALPPADVKEPDREAPRP